MKIGYYLEQNPLFTHRQLVQTIFPQMSPYFEQEIRGGRIEEDIYASFYQREKVSFSLLAKSKEKETFSPREAFEEFIERLDFSDFEEELQRQFFESIIQFGRLRRLFINHAIALDNELFGRLIEGLPKLEMLTLRRCSQITPKGLQPLFMKPPTFSLTLIDCSQLVADNYLSLSDCFENFTVELISGARIIPSANNPLDLHKTIDAKDIEAFKFLLSTGPNVNHRNPKTKKTLLQCAFEVARGDFNLGKPFLTLLAYCGAEETREKRKVPLPKYAGKEPPKSALLTHWEAMKDPFNCLEEVVKLLPYASYSGIYTSYHPYFIERFREKYPEILFFRKSNWFASKHLDGRSLNLEQIRRGFTYLKRFNLSPEILNLSDCELGQAVTATLSNICGTYTIKTLYLSSTQITEVFERYWTVQEIIDKLLNKEEEPFKIRSARVILGTVHSQSFAAQKLSSAEGKQFAEALGASEITHLDLGESFMGDKKIKELASSLPGTIEGLGLRSNSIGDGGIESIGKNLQRTSLSELDFSRNGIGSKGIGEFSKWLPNSETQILDISSNNIGGKGVKQLIKGLPNTKLLQLNVSGTNIGDRGLQKLAKHLPKTPLLQLNLSCNHILDGGAIKLAEYLRLTKIRELDLSSNRIRDAGAIVLAEVLPQTLVKEIDLSFNLIGEKGWAALTAMREKHPSINIKREEMLLST